MLNRRPIVWFAVCWIAGGAAAGGLNTAGLVLAAGSIVLAALAFAASRQASWLLAAACLAGFAASAGERLWMDARNATALTALPETAAAVERAGVAYEVEAYGIIASAIMVDGDRAIFRIKASAVQVHGEAEPRQLEERLLVHVRLEQQPDQETAAAWRRGDRIRIDGRLTEPAEASNDGGFDYRRYLRSQRIHWLFKATGVGAVETSPGSPWSAASLLGRVDDARDLLGSRFDELYPASQSGYMKGLVLGIREDLDPEQFQQFSRLGLTHILAISGLHVAVFLYVLGGLLRLLRMTRERMLLVMTAAVPAYVLLAGASPSVLRAGLMAMLGLVAARLGKLKDGMHLLAASAVLMLIWEPYYLSDVSFQLSYLVTAGLIIGVPPLRKAMQDWRKGRALLDLICVTVAAQAASFPVTIYYFNQFHLLSLPANLLLVPFISFIVMPLGAAGLVVGPLWPLGGKLLAGAGAFSNRLSFGLVDKLASADGLRSIWATPPLWWIAAWYGLYIAAAMLLRRRPAAAARPATDHQDEEETAPLQDLVPGQRNAEAFGDAAPKRRVAAPLLLVAAAVLLLAYAYYPDVFDRSGRVQVIDVGQGDAIHIRTPSGKHIVVDGGGTMQFRKPGEEWKERSDPFEVGRKVVVPLLMKRGVHEIDMLVVTHLDSDHIRGLKALIETIPVKRIWWNGTLKKAEDAAELFKLAEDRAIPLYKAEAGRQWNPDRHTRVTVLWPKVLGEEESGAGNAMGAKVIPIVKDQNESSVVLHLTLHESSFLLTGDINSDTEASIIRLWQPETAPLDGCCAGADVLKVAHHGSRYSTSEAWLRRWRPSSAVVSVGATNSYGHPHPDVLKRLETERIGLLRTDRDGETAYKATADGLFVKTVKSGR
ncbi:ComEC/Rec2 family competence protein [Paenibacillus sp. NPDC058071]|uniref:ComEC/Rec2 family competence protein n=1 Tax=Paenibacillus sp. NPDC058071 TaxID=3346326 RepID=UPI0036D83FB6